MEDLNFNLVIIIVFLVIGAIRWVLENIGGKKPPSQAEHWEEYDYEERDYHQPQPNSIEDLYEEARREILERQNRNAPQPEVVEEKLSEYQAPPTPPPIPGKARINRPKASSQKKEPVSFQKVKRPALSEEQKKALAAFEAHSSKKEPAQATATHSRVRELLATPSAARDAIILAEILGPPKGIKN